MRNKHLATAAVTSLAVLLCASAVCADEVPVKFTKHCAACHGSDLKGQTKAGKKKNTPDLSAAEIRAKFDRDRMIQSVTEGVKDEETGKDRMKAFGGKLSDAEIAALVDWVIGKGQ